MMALTLAGLAGLIILGAAIELFERSTARRLAAARDRADHRRLLAELERHEADQ